MSSASVGFDDLSSADLIVDAVYEGGQSGTIADDPIVKLLPVGNSGGFRYQGARPAPILVALCSSGRDLDWPDGLDATTGIYTYFGDNRTPGSPLLETPRGGNEILTEAFSRLHLGEAERKTIAPFLVFESTGHRRDNRFLGLAVPGSADLQASEDLVALWRSTAGRRFQNYRARFTILDAPLVERRWIDEVLVGNPLGRTCPEAFRAWAEKGQYRPLRAPNTRTHRSQEEQLPQDLSPLQMIWQRFADDPTEFEPCAAVLWRMQHGPTVRRVEVTRPTVDGGRDAIGSVAIGPESDPIQLDFALEAKCYKPGASSVGVRDVARLISRIRHRQFGVLVTTSYVAKQAYEEIRADGHPVVIMSGIDIVETLRRHGVATADQLSEWLDQDFRLGLK